MPETSAEHKPGMSNPAKILLAYMRLSNCWDSKELAERFTVPLRTIQRWKMECAANVSDATDATDGVSSEQRQSATRATDATDGAPLTPDMALAQDVHSCAGATKESPTEIVIPSRLDSPLTPQHIAVEPATAQIIPLPKTSSPRARGSRLDREWQLPEDWRMWARTNFPASTDAQVFEQAEQFRDYWIAKPGAQACKLDWEATWRNWCRRGLSQIGSVRKPASTGVFRSDAELFAQLRAEEAGHAAC